MRIDVDWRSSRLSALPLMRRTALMAVALAVLATAGVLNAQTSRSAKTQRKTGAAATLHETHRPLRSAGRTAAPQKTYSNIHANLTATRRKLTPDEAGREAGLAILRRRAGMQEPRRRMARMVRRHSTRRVRLERASWRSEESGATRTDESSDAADSYSAPEAGQAKTDEAQGMESRHTGTERGDAGDESRRN